MGLTDLVTLEEKADLRNHFTMTTLNNIPSPIVFERQIKSMVFPLSRPLGNMAITASVLAVVAVSTERFLAIVRPLQYKVE